mgnify:CR=1 FL=1
MDKDDDFFLLDYDNDNDNDNNNKETNKKGTHNFNWKLFNFLI